MENINNLEPAIYGFLTIIALLLGLLLGYILRKYLAEARIASAEEAAKRILEESEKEAEARKREVILEAKEEIHLMRNEAERENRERRNEVQRLAHLSSNLKQGLLYRIRQPPQLILFP